MVHCQADYYVTTTAPNYVNFYTAHYRISQCCLCYIQYIQLKQHHQFQRTN